MITPEILRAIPLFETLDEAELQEIAAAAADLRLVADEWLVHEGELPAFFVLLAGEIEVTKFVGGVEQVINHYHPGDFFGEVPLLLGSTVVANLRAVTDIRVLRLQAMDFHNLMVRSDKVAAHISRAMAWRVNALQRLTIEASVEMALIVGRPSELECHDLREFFAMNHIEFRWLDPDDPTMAKSIPANIGDGPYPIVLLADGTVLNNPSRREAANRLGLQTAPQKPEYDVVIIGGGPAGLAAAVYGASEGLQTLMVERAAPGGQAGTSSRIENYLGFPTGLSGDELSARALQQAKRFGAEIIVARSVKALQFGPLHHRVCLDDDEMVGARTVLIATGVSWRSVDIPGAEGLVGRGIYYGAARTEALRVRGKDVYLIGGGNSAGQAAMFFANYACSVNLLIRASSIEKGMSQYLIDQLKTKQNVFIHLNTVVQEVHGAEHLEAITVVNSKTKETNRYETDSLFVFIGADAETNWLHETIERDERGYILTGLEVKASGHWPLDRDPFLLETSAPGVFAAGDVRHGSVKRVAAGVGEGSMSIAFIHQYLALTEPTR